MYIVTVVSEPPVISYAGGVAGIPATDPTLAPGSGGRKRLDASKPNVVAYQRHLEASHDALLRSLATRAAIDSLATKAVIDSLAGTT